jgi:hypothetical protein
MICRDVIRFAPSGFFVSDHACDEAGFCIVAGGASRGRCCIRKSLARTGSGSASVARVDARYLDTSPMAGRSG